MLTDTPIVKNLNNPEYLEIILMVAGLWKSVLRESIVA